MAAPRAPPPPPPGAAGGCAADGGGGGWKAELAEEEGRDLAPGSTFRERNFSSIELKPFGKASGNTKDLLANVNFAYDTTIMPSGKEMCLLSEQKVKSGTVEDVAYFEPYYLKDFISLQKKKN